MKVSILGLHLGIGGVENAIASLANALSEELEVTIVVNYKVIDKPIFKINDKVKIIYLTNDKPNKEEFKKAIKDKKILNILKEGIKSLKILYQRKSLMKKYIKNSNDDVIISTRIIYNDILGKYGKGIKIAQEHRYHNNDKKYIKKLEKSLKNIDYFMPVSNYLKEFYENEFKNNKVIYGPLCLDYIPKKKSKLDTLNIVSIGRMSPEKGFLDLVEVMSYINNKNIILNIIGDGIEMPLIKEKIKKLKLKNIKLHGFQNKDYIHKILEKQSLYVMTSYEESFGLVLIEANSYGIPCIAFDTAKGACEIIDDNGILIKNRDKLEMARSIEYLLENKKLLNELGQNAIETSLKYSYENYKQFWCNFIKNVGGKND